MPVILSGTSVSWAGSRRPLTSMHCRICSGPSERRTANRALKIAAYLLSKYTSLYAIGQDVAPRPKPRDGYIRKLNQLVSSALNPSLTVGTNLAIPVPKPFPSGVWSITHEASRFPEIRHRRCRGRACAGAGDLVRGQG